MPTPRAEIIGNAVRDAKTGTSRDGKPYLFVTVACNDSHKADNGDWVTDRSIFINVQYFDADTRVRVPGKGDRVRAFGRIYETTDTGKDGQEYRNVKLDAKYLESWEKRQSNDAWGGGQQAQGGGAPAGSWGAVGSAPQSDEQPPF